MDCEDFFIKGRYNIIDKKRSYDKIKLKHKLLKHELVYLKLIIC